MSHRKSRVDWHEAASCAFQIELRDYSDLLEYIKEYIHLLRERKLTVAKVAPGVYHINNVTFVAQIIVTKELPSDDNLYLHQITTANTNAKGESSMVCEGLNV